MEFSIDNLVVLIQMACVMVVMSRVVTSSSFLKQSLSGKGTWKQTVIIMFLFGLLSIYGTCSGLEILGA